MRDASRLEAARLGRRALDRIEQAAALARARHGVPVAVGVDEDDLGLLLVALAQDAPRRLLPADLEALVARVGHVRRALDELRAVVQRVAERRDVQVGDVGEGEGHLTAS